MIRARLRKRANESKRARLIGYSSCEQARLSRRFSRISEASPPLMKLQRDIRRRPRARCSSCSVSISAPFLRQVRSLRSPHSRARRARGGNFALTSARPLLARAVVVVVLDAATIAFRFPFISTTSCRTRGTSRPLILRRGTRAFAGGAADTFLLEVLY